jgi:aspartate-semialdehyde dehydrogenase
LFYNSDGSSFAPLHKKYNIKRVVVSTYQSITGTGVKRLSNWKMNMQEFKAKWPINTLFIEMQFHNVMCLKKTDTKENEIGL